MPPSFRKYETSFPQPSFAAAVTTPTSNWILKENCIFVEVNPAEKNSCHVALRRGVLMPQVEIPSETDAIKFVADETEWYNQRLKGRSPRCKAKFFGDCFDENVEMVNNLDTTTTTSINEGRRNRYKPVRRVTFV